MFPTLSCNWKTFNIGGIWVNWPFGFHIDYRSVCTFETKTHKKLFLRLRHSGFVVYLIQACWHLNLLWVRHFSVSEPCWCSDLVWGSLVFLLVCTLKTVSDHKKIWIEWTTSSKHWGCPRKATQPLIPPEESLAKFRLQRLQGRREQWAAGNTVGRGR